MAEGSMTMILDGEPGFGDPDEVWEQWVFHLKTLRKRFEASPAHVRFLDEALDDARIDMEYIAKEGTNKYVRLT